MPLDPADLPERLRAILAQEYPRFSATEMQRRRAALEATMAAAKIDHLIVYGAQRVGGAIQWLTQWPITAEAAAVVTPGQRDALFVQYYNHLPLARRLASEARVEWGGESMGIARAIAELSLRAARRDCIGVIGPLGFRAHAELTAEFGKIADLNPAYTRLRLVKSAEEIDWLRIGAWFSDLGVEALRREARPGMDERALGAIVEGAYLPYGGVNQIHFFGATPMAAPDCCVPKQFPSTRKLLAGDVLFTEISAFFWDYSGQVLRSYAVAGEPTALYRDLFATAERAFDAISGVLRAGAAPAEIVAASSVIEQAGFTTYDDLLHGYGGGYLPPILGSKSRPAGKMPELRFEAGMTCVIQPNVVTKDEKAGVQVGELVLVTETGIERLHRAPRGFFRIGGA
jgi:Xaa-Pro dipeptidase